MNILVILLIFFITIFMFNPKKTNYENFIEEMELVPTQEPDTDTHSEIWFRTLQEFNDFEKKRIQIYIKNLFENPPPGTTQTKIAQEHKNLHFVEMNPESPFSLENNHIWKIHNHLLKDELDNIFTLFPDLPKDKLFKLLVHDTDNISWFEEPTIVKSRFINGKSANKPYAIIGKLRWKHHFGKVQEVLQRENLRNFRDKPVAKIVWRGQATGIGVFDNPHDEELFPREFLEKKPSREVLVENWFDRHLNDIDIGLVESGLGRNYRHFQKANLDITEMLDYKYILSVEGTDVSTGLKWNMASKSVVLMPEPTTESWFCESELHAWEHYVPVDGDFSDLLVKKKWCDENQEKCEEIIRNANEYVLQFVEEDRENYIFYTILKLYFSLVNFI